MVEGWIWELGWLEVAQLWHTACLSNIAGWWHLILVPCGSEGWGFELPPNFCNGHGHWRRAHVPSCSPEAPILPTMVYNRSPRPKRALPTRGAAVNLVTLCCFCLWFLGEWEGKGSCRRRWRQRRGRSERSPRWHGQPDPFSRAEYDKCRFILSWKEQDSAA